MPFVISDLLRRTSALTVVVALSTAHWMYGNLYEEVVTAPPALTGAPRAALVGPLELGSPVWYYGPTLVVSVVLMWVLAARLQRASRAVGIPGPARWVSRGAVAVAVAGLAKATLIIFVNPNFRNPSLAVEVRRQLTSLWLVANGAVVLLLAFSLVALLVWRPTLSSPGREIA